MLGGRHRTKGAGDAGTGVGAFSGQAHKEHPHVYIRRRVLRTGRALTSPAFREDVALRVMAAEASRGELQGP